MRVVVVGQGYVGLPLAMRAVEVGHDVVGYDIEAERVRRLNDGTSYVEDITDEVLSAAIATGRYRASADASCAEGFDVAVITVPTPLRESLPDLSFIETSVKTLAQYVRPGSTVILESTTYPGTTEELVGPLIDEIAGLKAGPDFQLGYSPERIDPGNRVWTFQNTPKVVSGVDERSLAAVSEFYDGLVDRVVPVPSPREAELTKLLENTFRHVNIALVNELAIFAQQLNIDIWAAIDAAETKPFGFMAFRPGPGVGGHCLPIDPSYLSWEIRRTLGHNFRFVELANDINDHMPDYVTKRLMMALNERGRALNGSNVLVLGLAYKRNTGDARESPSTEVVTQLLTLGANVSAVDPHIALPTLDPRISLVPLSEQALADADAVVLLTDHDDFDYDLIADKARYVLDTRARLVPSPTVERL
ncbi:MAG: UDP-N-acetyl-D-glucosamine dehydrogenase [Actinomycetota bacterium]|jgi:UDP-N-acetyl-D-glucosamine dehydrogenase|nr:UDP-N-acetyl-D-glucosamine dehydrogenase [Actinomycetota bacterium]